MSNVIIILVLAVVIIFAVRETLKHMKGEGSCCGGGSSYKPKKKKLKGTIVNTYELGIEGMHCQNCVNAVTGAINDIDGASARVSLRSKKAMVSCDREIDVAVIKEAIEKKGYEVV